jgi:beta-phosphoglucomutase-like phosphatase (HAD superfamily)
MKAIVFDSDGVLVDSMSSHYKAWKIAFKEVSNIDVDRSKKGIWIKKLLWQ